MPPRPWLRNPAKRSRTHPQAPRPRLRAEGPSLSRPHLDDPTTEAGHVCKLLQRLRVGVVVLRELRLHNLESAGGGEAQVRGGLKGPGPIRGSSLEDTPQTATAPPRHPRDREGRGQKAFSAPPTPAPLPHPTTRALPGYLQLLRGERCPRSLGRFRLTVLLRGHCPLQREAVPWGRQKWLITRPHLF